MTPDAPSTDLELDLRGLDLNGYGYRWIRLARRAWRGPRERYDLLKEGMIAVAVVSVLAVALALGFDGSTTDIALLTPV